MSVHEIIAGLKEKIAANPSKIATLNASYQFNLTGEGGGTYHAVFENGSYDIGEGPAAGARCTVTIAAADFAALVAGKLNPTTAFMTGKLKIAGDMSLAMKLQSVLG
jgi:putative sterol carrier protein